MAGASDTTGSRIRFVLDCSVALSWCFPDERGKAGDHLLSRLSNGGAVVPPLWFLEVSNALLMGERRRRLSPEETAEAFDLLSQLPLEIDSRSGFPLAVDLLSLARKHKLSAYDAAYLELARRLHLPLATLDRSLQKAAKSLDIALAT